MMIKLWHSFWPKNMPWVRGLLLIALSCLVINKLILVYLPFVLKKLINTFDGNFSLAVLHEKKSVAFYFLAVFVGLRIFGQLFSDARDLAFSKISQRVLRNMGLSVFKHIHTLSLSYHLGRKTGGLSSVIERGTKGIESFVRFMGFNLVPTLFEIIMIAAIFTVIYEWPYAVVTILTLLSYIVFTVVISRWRIDFVRKMNAQENLSQGKAIDSLLNYETVKYFTNEQLEADRFESHLEEYEKVAFKNMASLGLLNIGQIIIMMVGLGCILAMGVNDLSRKIITLGDFVAMHSLLLQVFIPLSFFGFAFRETKIAMVNIEEMLNVLNEPVDVTDKPDAKDIILAGGEITFDHVTFGYNPDRRILHDLSFTIEKGKTLAVVGGSGAGKSTLARLLYRFYEVKDGAVLVDGQNINDVTQESLRSAIGIVPQDTVLFNDTIGYNIAYGKAGATQAEIAEVAKKANIADFIESLPDKYETLVGERGLKLSGGEKQRVSIARTLLKNPEILIFDEATSALDTKNEKLIQDHLNSLAKNHTTVIIAHRLSTVVDADNIIVLEKGRIIESGTHAQLVQLRGHYYDMWQRQKERKDHAS